VDSNRDLGAWSPCDPAFIMPSPANEVDKVAMYCAERHIPRGSIDQTAASVPNEGLIPGAR